MENDAVQGIATAPRSRSLNLSRFDKRVVVVMAVLIGLTLLTIGLGDRVGVTLDRMDPRGEARSTASIVLRFSEAMNRDSVPAHLRVLQIPLEKVGTAIQPSDVLATVNGTASWNGTTMTFHPKTPLKPGAAYQVKLDAGATSDTGRPVLSDYQFDFTIRTPKIAYLAPADSVPRNIWIADPNDPSSAKQVTNSPSGIDDFAISPDGSQIAFTEENSTAGTKDIKLLDLDTGGIEQVTNCADATCDNPTWRPDGQTIAYERVDFNSNLLQGGKAGPTRIWLIDLSSKPATTHPMFSDSQTLGYGLDWSADGQRAVVFDLSSQGILMHDFSDNSTILIPTDFGDSGVISPDGTRVVFPEVIFEANETRSYLRMVDLKAQSIVPLTDPNDPIDDGAARWSPDGSYLIIARRYVDQRYTPGDQLYKLDPTGKTIETLLYDPAYGNGFFSFDPTGTQLVVQRFAETSDASENSSVNSPGVPGIWTLDLQSKALKKVADDALFGRWVP